MKIGHLPNGDPNKNLNHELFIKTEDEHLRLLGKNVVAEAQAILDAEELDYQDYLADAQERAPLAEQSAFDTMRISEMLAERSYPDERPFMEHGFWSLERPQRPHDLELKNLGPGKRVVLYDDKLPDKEQHAKHETITSKPYIVVDDSLNELWVVNARQVGDHATDPLPPNAVDNERPVNLSTWGIVPSVDGLYKTTSYVEPFIKE